MIPELRINDRIVVDNEPGKDGELNICIEDCGRQCGYDGCDVDVWIDKKGAIELIEHLKAVFKI